MENTTGFRLPGFNQSTSSHHRTCATLSGQPDILRGATAGRRQDLSQRVTQEVNLLLILPFVWLGKQNGRRWVKGFLSDTDNGCLRPTNLNLHFSTSGRSSLVRLLLRREPA